MLSCLRELLARIFPDLTVFLFTTKVAGLLHPLADPGTLKEFTDEYMAHCEEWREKKDEIGKNHGIIKVAFG